MRASRTFDGTSGSIAGARRLATAFLGEVAAAEGQVIPDLVVDTAQLVVSELVTNAVRHTDGPCGLDVELVNGAVELSVWDTSSQPVSVMERDPARVGRHGMEIVTALCGGFEVVPTAAGKRVVVRIPL
ncbi:ATP-binding protein [Streptomyces sp. NPDC049040]|uniref:ATP-binding protein n=1 Tax=Streptomyces sp. NPDC049040 TaxID=3365593 RepID=UPI00372324AA